MTSVRIAGLEDFHALRARWMALVAEGDFAAAFELVEAATAWAKTHGDATLLDRVLCNRAAIALELGRGEDLVPGLRTLLMRSDDRENAFLAAYTIARHYELAKETKKGLFYAQLARDRAADVDLPRRGSSLNLIANFLVSECRYEEALATYAEAEGCLAQPADAGAGGPADRLRAAVIGYNVGYCRVVTGDVRDGLAKLYRSLRSLKALGASRHVLLASLDLSFALLEAKRPEKARRHAERAIALAAHFDDPVSRKNALYLSGAAASAAGDELGARRRFAELQGAFFPEADYLPDLLLRVDVRQLVNLKA
jgi:tetratricopeptide (TPR) repeat protein